MLPLYLRPGESLDRAIGKFKKITKETMLTLKEKRYFQKPSEIKNVQNETRKHLKDKNKKQEEKLRLRKNMIKRKGQPKYKKKSFDRDGYRRNDARRNYESE